MKKKYHLILSLPLIMSCNIHRYIYAPAAPNITYFTEKGDSKTSAAVAYPTGSSGNRSSGVDLQAAYAFSDHWAGHASWFHRKEYQTSATAFNNSAADIHYKRNIFDVGVGYFFAVNDRKTVTINVFGGVGFGRFYMQEMQADGNSGDQRNFDIDVVKWYLQPSVNLLPGDYLRASFYLKPVFVGFKNAFSNYSPEETRYFGFDKIQHSTIYFPELGYNLQIGIPNTPWLWLDISVTHLILGNKELLYQTRLASYRGNLSLGIVFDFAKIGRKAMQ